MSRFRDPHLRTGARRKVGVVVGITSLLAAGAVGLSTPAQADDSSTLTVVGTSDVFDSNLVQSVIKPGFEAYYKKTTGNDITLNYVSRGTGAAIAYAKAGTASALIVHAASLENQFVADGYSSEPYGRAIFFGDYVLLGPASDPAGVLDTTTTPSSPSHDIAQAFEKIATAGAKHTARFVSRGGTPGTTVQEHAIWSLTSGVPTCTVTAANGGGTTPSTDTGTCSASPKLPPWYKSTGLTQGPNVTNGDACNYASTDDGDSSNSDCYVFTDRGTFQYLRSQGSIANLKIVTQDNSTDARGGSSELINSFHAYAVNPDKFAGNPNVQINSAGAQAFLNWQTSPAGQAAVGKFLADDPDGAPFLPSAAPAISYTTPPASVTSGSQLVLRATLRNVVPGTPTLSGVTVNLNSAPTATPSAPLVHVATATSNSAGAFAFFYKPDQSRRYSFSTRAITKVENSTLDPVFGDLLAPTTVAGPTVAVVTTATNVKSNNDRTQHVVFTGTLGPKVTNTGSSVSLFARRVGATGAYPNLGNRAVPNGSSTFAAGYNIPKGMYLYRIQYNNPGHTSGQSALLKLSVR